MTRHIWKGNGWRQHVVWWAGGYVGLRWVTRHCSEPTCEINAEGVSR